MVGSISNISDEGSHVSSPSLWQRKLFQYFQLQSFPVCGRSFSKLMDCWEEVEMHFAILTKFLAFKIKKKKIRNMYPQRAT